MAKTGTAKFTSLSQKEALEFIENRSILSTGHFLYISSRDTNEPEVFFGIGRTLPETPGFNGSTIASVAGLLNGSLVGPHTHSIGDVLFLQASLDSKSIIGHIHDDRYYTESEIDAFFVAMDAAKSNVGHGHVIGDITSLQTTLDSISSDVSAIDVRVTALEEGGSYIPGETAVDEGIIP